MTTRRRFVVTLSGVFVLGVALLLSACRPSRTPQPTPFESHPASPFQIYTISPTSTPKPSATRTAPPTLSATPKPTSSSTPSVTAMPAVQNASSATTTPVTTHVPLITNNFRAQVPLLGVALEYFTAPAGWERGLELNIRWARRWAPLAWRDVEPRESEYHWEALAGFESELLAARARGVTAIVNIQYTPEWAQAVPPYACGPIREDKFSALAAFMEQLAARYGSSSPYSVRYWQIGNELDLAPAEVLPDNIYGCWGDLNDPYYGGGHYAAMLKVVYPRIKAADPAAQIIMGGLLLECDPATTTPGVNCINERRWKSGYFLEGVMRSGGGDYFDIYDVHSYAEFRPDLPARMHSYYAWSGSQGGTGLPEKVAFVRQVMGAYGYSNKPIIATELALKCQAPTPDCYEAAAAFVPRVYAEAYGLNLRAALYYPLLADSAYYSLLPSDLTPKPSFHAYRFLSSWLLNTRYERPMTEYAGVTGYEFNQEGTRHVQIVWSTDGTDRIVPIPSSFIQAWDKLGNSIPTVDGQLVIGWSPIYIETQ